jgi:hypothetical protein
MRVGRIFFALFTLLGIIGTAPIWVWYLDNHTAGLTPESRFLALLVLPALVLLFIASWLQPGGS